MHTAKGARQTEMCSRAFDADLNWFHLNGLKLCSIVYTSFGENMTMFLRLSVVTFQTRGMENLSEDVWMEELSDSEELQQVPYVGLFPLVPIF